MTRFLRPLAVLLLLVSVFAARPAATAVFIPTCYSNLPHYGYPAARGAGRLKPAIWIGDR